MEGKREEGRFRHSLLQRFRVLLINLYFGHGVQNTNF